MLGLLSVTSGFNPELILCAWLDSEIQEFANSHRVVTRSLVVRTQKLVPPVENPELTDVLPLKPGVCQNIATHASPTARNFFLALIWMGVKHQLTYLIWTFPVHSPSFFPSPKSLPTF